MSMDNFDLKSYLINNPLLEEEGKLKLPSTYTPERDKEYLKIAQRQIQDYIEGGSEGDLDLYDTPITSLPDNLKVGGGLDLDNTPITTLPDNLKVGGSLWLENTRITSLPNNLKVGGNIYLNRSQITSLPNNLEVGGFLGLENTPITSLPNNLKVGGNLYLRNTPISEKYTEEEIRKMIEEKGGSVRGAIYL